MVKGYNMLFQNDFQREIIKLKDIKYLQVQLLVIGDQKKKTQTPIVGNRSSKKLTSGHDFYTLQEFPMKPCLSHPCG